MDAAESVFLDMSKLRFYLLLSGAILALAVLAWRVVAPHPTASSVPTDSPLASVAAPASQKPLRYDNPVPAPEPALSPELSLERRCLALAEHDPIEAMEFALNHHLLETQPGLLENLTGQWASHDFKAAHEWLRKQEPGDWRDQLMARVAYVGSQSDPAAAAQIVSTEMAPGPKQNEAAISVLHQWAQRDSAAAAAWVDAFPPGDLRTRAQAELEGIRHYQAMTQVRP